jgi:hypothetical protein
MCEPHDPAAEYLSKLGVELSGHGIISELITTGVVPRLRLENIPWDTPQGLANGAFEDHVLAVADAGGTWRFWWPWIEPIGPADDLAGAATRIFKSALEPWLPDDDIDEGGQSGPVTDFGGKAPLAGLIHH